MRFAPSIIFCLMLLSSASNGSAQTPELRSDTGDKTPSDIAVQPDSIWPDSIWEVCNETSFIIRLAHAVIRDGAMRPKGWELIRAGQCFAVEAAPGSPRYIFAESSPIHQGGIREWAGQTPLCVSTGDFTADATQSCPLQNLDSRNYMAVNPAEIRTTLIEPQNYGVKAEIAGVQRLLRDNGYKVSRIDGLTGRRTNRYIREFKKAQKLDADIDNTQLTDALAAAAKETQSGIGLEICNDSNAKIWSALAIRENGGWQSKGWWTIDTTECVRPYTKSLKGTDAHFFALQENIEETEDGLIYGPDKRLKSVAATPTQFCIAEAKFSALGREYCAESGYAVANFRPLPTDIDGTKAALTDQDFTAPNAAGLR